MKPGLPVAFTLIVLGGSGVAFAAYNGGADLASAPIHAEKHVFSPADHAAFLDARIAALHAGLELTPDQEKLWPGVETALRAAAKNATDRYQKFKDEPRPANLVERLRRRGENAVARGENLQAVAAATSPLYTILNEDQKHRLPVLMHGLRPHLFNRHFAMMGGEREHEEWRGDRDEHKSVSPGGGDHQNFEDR